MRNNNQPFMTKTLHKAIMKRSKLKNKFNQEWNAKNWFNYKQQRNYCSNLLTESKTRHFDNRNVKDVTENNCFWNTRKPFYIYEPTNNNNILNENYQIIRQDEKICKIFYAYFANVTKGLKFRQVDKTQSIENEGSCRLIKEHFGNRSF